MSEEAKPVIAEDIFEKNGFRVNDLGDAITAAVGAALERPVSILLFVIDDESGAVCSASNIPPEQMGDFLNFVLRSRRSGEYRLEVAPERTVQ